MMAPVQVTDHSLPMFQPMGMASPRNLRRRCHRLQITDAELLQCQTIGDIQRLARLRYHRLALRYHPDTGRHPRNKGTLFQRVTKTYHWLMALNADERVVWSTPQLPPWQDRNSPDLGWGWQLWQA